MVSSGENTRQPLAHAWPVNVSTGLPAAGDRLRVAAAGDRLPARGVSLLNYYRPRRCRGKQIAVGTYPVAVAFQ
jgi:hypothetical protein